MFGGHPPMSTKRRYRAVRVKDVDAAGLQQRVQGQCACVAIDVGKEDMFAAFVNTEGEVAITVKWKHPRESGRFLELLQTIADEDVGLAVAMEPSGTYGDALRHALIKRSFDVYRVNPKHTSDTKEIYDGVPSLHDAKSAAIIAKLHRDGRSERWPIKSERERTLSAALRVLEVHDKEFQRGRNRLANLLARHWPEVTQHLDLGSATLLELLIAFGGPKAVATDTFVAKELMHRVGGHFLSTDKVTAVIASAATSFGMPMLDEECAMVQHIAAETRRHQQLANRARRHVEKLSATDGATKYLAPVVGKATAAVLVAAVGDPQRFGSARAYLKSVGLNLKEKSSGKSQGALHITKRGPGVARFYLWLAALRLLQRDPVVRAWYAKKLRRQGGQYKSKAVVAIMRKLVLALWHVAAGATFDAAKLFDTRRLSVKPVAIPSP